MKRFITKSLGILINATARLFPKWSTNFSFNLLCKVQQVGISEKGRKFLGTAQTTFLNIDGHAATLHHWGTGPKVVFFLHGWMSNSQRWQPYLERLDLNQHTVYALDAPGHGMSKGKHLNIEMYRKAVVKSIEKIGRIDTLICHSLGSLIAAYNYLSNTQTPIASYVIMGAPSGMDAIFAYFQDLLGLSEMAIANLDTKVNAILKIPHQDILMARFFEKVDRPVLVIHDVADTITPFEPIERALQQHKAIEAMFTTGLKHDLKSEDVYTRVIAFIEDKQLKTGRSYSA